MTLARCFNKIAPQDGGPPLFQQGNIVFQAHHVGWIITAFFTMVATITSFWLVNKHLQWYTNKREQRYIVRILFMVPIYATISFASYLFWNHHTPLLLIRDCYESTALTAFFYLLLTYLSPDPDQQKAIFIKAGLSHQADREARRKGGAEGKWIFPLGFVKWKPEDGLYFLQLMKWGILQYCVIRPITTLAAVILNYMGLYCEDSWSPRWGHAYITVVVSISVSIAMFCLIQLYVLVATYLAPHKPLLKLFSIKTIVFLTFWQATLLGLLGAFGVIKDTRYMTADDIVTGFGALIETLEMMIFAFIHIKAFSYKPYRPVLNSQSSRTSRWRSLGQSFDFRETIREITAGAIYVFDRWRGHEPRPDRGARRAAYLEEAFGKNRHFLVPQANANPQREARRLEVEVVETVDVDIEGERQWLGLGDNYVYGLGYARREKSDGLGQAIEKELHKRGFNSDILYREPRADGYHNTVEPVSKHRAQSSWWRGLYQRVSQSGAENEGSRLTPIPSKRRSRSRRPPVNVDPRSLLSGYDYDEPPPPSAIRTYRTQRYRQSSNSVQGQTQNQLPVPHEESQTGRDLISIPPVSLNHQAAGLDRHPPDLAVAASKRLPSSPLIPYSPIRLDNVFAPSTTDHDLTSELGISSPISASAPLAGLVFSQPLAPKTAVVSPGNFYKSEIGHIQVEDQEISPRLEGAVATVTQDNDPPQPSPPPVPPKSTNREAPEELKPRRSSHRRESAFHNPPLPPPTPSDIPNTQSSDPAITGDTPSSSDIYHAHQSASFLHRSQPSSPDSSMSIASPKPRISHRSSLPRRPRQAPLSPLSPSVPPKRSYTPYPTNRRMSGSLQPSVPMPTDSHNRTVHRPIEYHDTIGMASHTSPTSLQTSTNTSRYLIPNSRPGRSPHIPRVAVMPPLLAAPPPPNPTGQSPLAKGHPDGRARVPIGRDSNKGPDYPSATRRR